MQKPMGKWVKFRNNQARLTGNGVAILGERMGWVGLDCICQELYRRSGVEVGEIDRLIQGYLPKVRLETLSRIAYVFGFRLRGSDIEEELLRFFMSQQRPMNLP